MMPPMLPNLLLSLVQNRASRIDSTKLPASAPSLRESSQDSVRSPVTCLYHRSSTDAYPALASSQYANPLIAPVSASGEC